MKARTMIFPALLAAAALMLTIPVATLAADQTRTMDQDQMYSKSSTANAGTGQYRESFMFMQQTANMGSDDQVKAGEPKTRMLMRSDSEKTGDCDGSKGGRSKK